MKKQTAVEWLLQAIEGKNGKEFSSYYLEFIEQAIEMEKEQITNAYVFGSCYGIDLDKGLNPNNYFQETYKRGEQ